MMYRKMMYRFSNTSLKLKWASRIVGSLLMVLSFQACESHEQTVDDAFERVKEEKLLSDSLAPPTNPVANVKSPATAGVPHDKWKQFKDATHAKLRANSEAIARLKSLPDNGKIVKKVLSLEKENELLRSKTEAFELEEAARRAEFETTMHAEIATIAAELSTMEPVSK